MKISPSVSLSDFVRSQRRENEAQLSAGPRMPNSSSGAMSDGGGGGEANGGGKANRGMLSLSGLAATARTMRYEHFVAGISGGVVSTLLLHPLDLLKIRFAGEWKAQWHSQNEITPFSGRRWPLFSVSSALLGPAPSHERYLPERRRPRPLQGGHA